MDLMPNVHFAKNQIIFDEGYPAEAVFLICEGTVEIFKQRDGKVVLAKLTKDAIFGEMALISERPRSASVRALDEVWCYSVNKDTFMQRLKNTDPIIVNVFHDLVDTIRTKSNAAVLIDHGRIIAEQPGVLAIYEKNNVITPGHSYEYVTQDEKLKQKVEMMDLFMRKLFASLVKIAYM